MIHAMKCIFCLQDRPCSDEHIFPFAIGADLVFDRVCAFCNSMLGISADAPLVEHPLVLLRRWQLSIPDRNGETPDAIGKILKFGVLADDPSQRYRLTTDKTTREPKIELLHGEKAVALPDGGWAKQVSIDAVDLKAAKKKLETILQRERQRHKLPSLTPGELEIQVTVILAQKPQTLLNPTINTIVKMDGFGFNLGLLKIAYEIAFRWLGECYLVDPYAEKIRAILRAASREDAISAIGQIRYDSATPHEGSSPPFLPWRDDVNEHIAYLRMNGDSLVMFVRVFDCVSCSVQVTESCEQYARGQLDPSVIRFIGINATSRQTRETSYIDEIGRLYSIGRFALPTDQSTCWFRWTLPAVRFASRSASTKDCSAVSTKSPSAPA